jgi:hypothetical protein
VENKFLNIPYLKVNGKYRYLKIAKDGSTSALNNRKPISPSAYQKSYDRFEFVDYDEAFFYIESFASVRNGKRWSYIDSEQTRLRLEHDYEAICDFKDGIAPVKRDGLWYFINKNGIEITTHGYE